MLYLCCLAVILMIVCLVGFYHRPGVVSGSSGVDAHYPTTGMCPTVVIANPVSDMEAEGGFCWGINKCHILPFVFVGGALYGLGSFVVLFGLVVFADNR